MPDLSRSQVDRLGRRLRRAGLTNLPDEDRDLLEQLIASHGPVLAAVQKRLAEALGLSLTSRTKTTGTLIEKLQRNPSMALSRMQDIAGVRLVSDMNRTEQDEVVARIVELFPGADVIDRRAEPSYGYRAVHVVVEVDRKFVEIQVRTVLQDLWAQLMERFADAWGRGMRYGDLPNDPDKEIASGYTRRKLFERLKKESEQLAVLERVAADLTEIETFYQSNPPTPDEEQQIQELKQRYQSLEEDTREFYRAIGLLK